MADFKVVESDGRRGSCEQSPADQRENNERNDVMDIKEKDTRGLRNEDQEEWLTDEEEEERSGDTNDDDKKITDGEEEEREASKDNEEEQEREEEEEEAEEKENVRHKEPKEDEVEGREVENGEDKDIDKEEDTDNNSKDTEESNDGDSDRDSDGNEVDKSNYNDHKGNDNDCSGKSFVDKEKRDDEKRGKKGKGVVREYCSDADNVIETAPSEDIRADTGLEDSDSCDTASSSRSKDDSPVANPRGQTLSSKSLDVSRGKSEEGLEKDELRRPNTDSEDEDGSGTEDGKDAEDGAEDAKDNEEDNEDAAEDAENKEEEGGNGIEDDRVLVERGGKFSFLSVRELTSQEKKLYGLVSSDSVPTLASTPKLQPMPGRSDKRSMRLPLLGAKQGVEPAGPTGSIGSRAKNRVKLSDSIVATTSGKKTVKMGDSISATSTVRTVRRRRSEKTSSCPTVSLTDRRKSGWTSMPAGPSKAQTDSKIRSQDLKPRFSRSAGGDAQPGVEPEPGTLYRSPYAFSPERRRELGRRLKDRMENAKKVEHAKRQEEESRRKEAEQAFNVWMENKRRKAQQGDDQESNPKLSKKLIEATQRDAAEAAFNEWLMMKKRQRMDEMRRREEERQKYFLALENAISDRQRAEKAYKRWMKKKQKTVLVKKRWTSVAAAGSTSSRHHVTTRGQKMLTAATMRREPVQRSSRCLLPKTSSSASQFPPQQLSLATAANYFRLLYGI